MKKILISEEMFDKTIFEQKWFYEEYKFPTDTQVVEIEENYYIDCTREDFDFVDGLYSFNVEKYNARKQKENEVDYENKIISKIRQKYTINQELAILRQRDTKPLEYQEYFDYVEQCKAEAKSEVLNDNNTIN